MKKVLLITLVLIGISCKKDEALYSAPDKINLSKFEGKTVHIMHAKDGKNILLEFTDGSSILLNSQEHDLRIYNR